MDLKKAYKNLVCPILLALTLSGCAHRAPCSKWLDEKPYFPAEPLIIPPKPVSLFQQREYDICLLQKNGVQVIRLGQTWKLIFPSDDVFNDDTSEINGKYKPLLAVAANFMRTYSKISVKIAGYSNAIADDTLTKFGTITDELTTRQAEAVLKYFTCHHINARLIYAVGKGGHHPVAWNGSAAGRRLNRRIEVSFRYYRDNTAWY